MTYIMPYLYVIIRLKDVADLSKISQILKLIALLETTHIITKSELAERLGTNVRNIRSYIEELRAAGISVEGISGCRGGHFLSASSQLRPPQLDQDEYTALLLAEKVLTQKNGFVMENELKTAMAKIKWALGDTSLNVTPELPEEFICSYGRKDSNDKVKDIFELVHNSIYNKQCIKIRYYSPVNNEVTTRTVNPYGLVYREGSWYLVAYCRLREEIRTFKLVRISRLDILHETFVYPHDFTIKNYMRDSFSLFQGETYKIEIRFYHPASIYVKEKIWVPSQKILELDDDSIIFRAKVKGLTEIKNWVMSFGRYAIVREPDELKKQIAYELISMIYNYEDDLINVDGK